MTIQFSGLATGLDTKSIISQLMALEQQPITRLKSDQTWLQNRLTAFSALDTKLQSFSSSITNLGDADTLLKKSVTQSSTDYLSASVSSDAQAGASYQAEVVSLAHIQKSVALTGVADKTLANFGTGTLTLTVDGTTHSIDITSANNSLQGIMQAINGANLGVSAGIINDGTASGYRLALTGANVGKTFSLSSNLTGGTDLGSFDLPIDNVADQPVGYNPPVQVATKAHIRVDTVDIYSDSNTLTEAIPGVTLNLLQAKEGTTTTINVSLDKSSLKSTIQAFAQGYNDVVSFITGQSVIDGKGGGILNGDSGLSAIKRHLQSMLTSAFPNSGSLKSISQLGLETQKDGTLTVNDKTLSTAIDSNLNGVVSLLAGSGSAGGVGRQFKDYLSSLTNATTGLLQGRTKATNNNLKNIANQITNTQARLDQKQKTMEAQFSAMETLVSGLNSQSTYLTQQMTAISNIMNYGSKSS
jgi:flagellar hook-associated protein 2